MRILKGIRKFLHYLIVTREYKQVDGVAYIRGRGKDWEPLLEHLEKEHPNTYQQLKEGEEVK